MLLSHQKKGGTKKLKIAQTLMYLKDKQKFEHFVQTTVIVSCETKNYNIGSNSDKCL